MQMVVCRVRLSVFVIGALSFGVMLMTMAYYLARGEGILHAIEATPIEYALALKRQGGMDSLAPMLSGHARAREAAAGQATELPQESPYRRALVLDRCKFQYPPSSWFLIEWLPEPPGLPLPCALPAAGATSTVAPPPTLGTVPWTPREVYWIASAFGCLALVAVSVALLGQGGAEAAWRRAGGWTALVAASLAALLFYPLLKPHFLGNLQVFINLAIGGALLLFRAHPVASGVLVGLCGLLKPQYAPLVLWGLLRQQRGFAVACATVLLLGHGAAVLRYGLDVHLQYIDWLQHLARSGEGYWGNQSLNGLLNRLLGTGDPLRFVPDEFANYHPLVRWATLLSSLGLFVVALWPLRRPTDASIDNLRQRGVPAQLDLAAMLCAVTLASPIAWEHHYGSFLPVFALLVVALARQPVYPLGSALLLAVCFLLVAHAPLRPDWIFVNPWMGLLGSHLFFGALGVFALLLYWRRADATVAPRPAH